MSKPKASTTARHAQASRPKSAGSKSDTSSSNGPAAELPSPGRIIDVVTLFDTETILRVLPRSTSCKRPRRLAIPVGGQSPVYMLTNWVDNMSGQGSGNLEIQAKVNDIVVWRSQSLSSNTGDGALINAIQSVKPGGVIGKPMLVLTRPTVPIMAPPGGCPCSTTDETITDVFWCSRVRAIGSTTYAVFFCIVTDDGMGNGVQYFYTWSCKITVTEPNEE